jgi:hypothetical protein
MSDRWIGIVVASDKITLVDAEVPRSGAIVLQGDHSWLLQKGDRPSAYRVMHQQIADYVRENCIGRAVVKASAVSLGGTKKAHLEAAELRGVVIAATATFAKTVTIAKNHISRTFGDRKTDEYLADDTFWSGQLAGKGLRVGSREAAMVLLAARNDQ